MGWLASLGLHFGDIVSLGACCGVRGLLIVGVVGRALLLLLAGGRRWSVVSSCLFFWSNGVDSCMLMRGRLLVDGLLCLASCCQCCIGKKGGGGIFILF